LFGEQFAPPRFHFVREFFQAFATFIFLESARLDIFQAFTDAAANAAQLLLGDRNFHLSHGYLAIFSFARGFTEQVLKSCDLSCGTNGTAQVAPI
jgi:hypothetical protein